MSAEFDIQIPATEQQIAEAIRWAADSDANIIRRLAFERDRLKGEIEYLKGLNQEMEKQASRAIDEAKYDAACEAEQQLQDGIRSREQVVGVMKRKPTCKCTHSLSLFCASLIPQDWMQHSSHSPAVRCQCGKSYYSLSQKKSFNSRNAKAVKP